MSPRDCYRVFLGDGSGGLALSRALGDENYKSPDGKSCLVPAEAEITVSDYSHGDILILASDGIFETFSNENLAMFVNHLKQNHPAMDAAGIAQEIVFNAYIGGSSDNLTAVSAILPKQ